MTSTPDPFTLLRRAVAVRAAGLPEPPEVRAWLTDSLAAIARGADPAEVLGLKATPGRRKPSTKARYAARDRALAALLKLPAGGEVARGETIVAWLDAPSTAPPEARPLVDEVRRQRCGWPTDPRALARAAARAA
jgi:hypothetical protein